MASRSWITTSKVELMWWLCWCFVCSELAETGDKAPLAMLALSNSLKRMCSMRELLSATLRLRSVALAEGAAGAGRCTAAELSLGACWVASFFTPYLCVVQLKE